MNLLQRYRRLTLWNRIGVWGSLASVVSLLLAMPSFHGRAAHPASSPENERARPPAAIGRENTSRYRPAPFVVAGALTVAELKRFVADIRTARGIIRIEFLPEVAPNHARNFVELAKQGFYNGTTFYRVHPLFMIQGGDPNSRLRDRSAWGSGGSAVE